MLVRSDVMCICKLKDNILRTFFNPLNAELNPICHLLALLGVNHILHVSRIRVKYPKDAELKQVDRDKWQIEIAAVPKLSAIIKSSLNDEE